MPKKPPIPGYGKKAKKAGDEPEDPQGRSRYEVCQDRVKRARKIRAQWERDYQVERCESYFLGNQRDSGRRETDLVFNRFQSTVKAIRPNLMTHAPKFFVRPKPGLRQPAQDLNGKMGEGTLEAIGDQDQNLKVAVRMALLQAFFRPGVIKVTYDPRMLPNPQAGQPLYETTEAGTPLLIEGTPVQKRNPLTGEPLVEPDEVLDDEAYRYAWVDSRTMLFPDQGPDASKWTWLAEEVTVPLEEAKADPRFPKALRERFVANGQARKEDSRQKVRQEQDDRFTYVEYYDFAKARLSIWADGQDVDEWLLDGPVPDGVEDHPYALLILGDPILGPVPSPWPVPFTYHWLDPAYDYNQVRSMVSTGARRSARKGIFYDGTFENSDEAVKLLENPDDMVFARVLSPQLKPEILASPDLNAAIYKSIPILENDWRMITGQTGARLGDPEGDTATESTFVERAANLRDVDLQDVTNDWLSTMGRKMFQLVKKTLTLNLYVQLKGFKDKDYQTYLSQVLGISPEMGMLLPGLKEIVKARFGTMQWQQVSRADLTFEADVSVVPGSARPKNLDVERKQWLSFLQILGSAPQLALSRQLLQYTAEKFDMHDDQLLDELSALAQKMVQVNANQAGRNQGGGAAPGGNGAAGPGVETLLAGVTGGQM